MSFDVLIQKNLSEKIRLDKTLVDIATVTGVLREASSIINPSILVEGDLTTFSDANYLRIPALNRAYFINDIVSFREGLVQLNCHVDVLSTYSGAIRNNKGIIFRQENDWNLYLNDGVLEVYQNPIVVTKVFPGGFDGQSYVLALAGRRGVISQGETPVIPGPGSGIGYAVGNQTGTGAGSKSAAGMAAYALAHIGDPYWWGTFGNTASQALLDAKIYQYPDFKAHSGGSSRDYTLDFGKQVFDCVGLIHGYRWSASTYGDPTAGYVGSQDTGVRGLAAECSITFGSVGDLNWQAMYAAYPGVLLFWSDYSHVGVSMGDGTVIECTTAGGANCVVRNQLANRTGFTMWGMPAWYLDNAGTIEY